MTFHVFAVNHAPAITVANNNINPGATGSVLTEDHSYAFATADFNFSDVDGNSLLNVILVSTTGSGSFTVNGNTVGAGSVIAASDISNGLFKYTPPADANGTNLASFIFRVQDNGGTDNNGVDTSVLPGSTMTLNVTPVNDAPPQPVLGADPSAIDENPQTHGPAAQTTVSGFAKNISAGPANESAQTLHFNVAPVTPSTQNTPGDDSFFTSDGQPAIDASGNLTFKVKPNAHGTANFKVTLQDNGGTTNNGVDTSSPVQIIHINVSKPEIWHNTAIVGGTGVQTAQTSGLDVNDDTHVAANDVVAVINYINGFGKFLNGAVPTPGTQLPNGGGTVGIKAPFGYLDVNSDGFVAANDALAIINVINAGQAGGEGEGEAVANDSFFADLGAFDATPAQQSAVNAPAPADSMNDLIALLAADSFEANQQRRRV